MRKVYFILFAILICLYFPKIALADIVNTGGCGCGSHPEGNPPTDVCNVGCVTTVYCVSFGLGGGCWTDTEYNECSGPAQCPGGCCGGGQCGLCEGSCIAGETWNAIGTGTGAVQVEQPQLKADYNKYKGK